ncbi:G-protein coupled receptor GRL101-like [Ylistrum balloti]|uniref:G-protein coupled receptor GRL101-like n=1 Tax=Ylistrum balloti TaxID=509963 RepID=UPI002905A903|nr:G-protein coupled receptor GRL101-like [Ylistrum balloti]
MIYLENNQITSLPGTLFPALTRLHINNNLITALSNYILYGLYSLKELDLSNNRIVVLQDNLFSGVSALTYLDLSKNRISFLPGQTDELFEKTYPFDDLSALTYLDLSNNEIRDLPADLFDGLSALSYLDLSNNGIRDLPEDLLDGLSVLSYLDLSNNEIMGLPGNLFYRLMDLSNDNPFDRQSALTYLHLKNNKIKEIPDHVFYGLFSLIKLDLSHNEITDLSSNLFDGLPALSYLHLENNQIRVLSKYIFGRLFNLSDLILDNNRLREFQENIFTGLHRLRNLSLINNGLTAFPRDSFEELSRLEGIYLANNMLSALPVLPSSLSFLDISYNSFLDLPTGTFTNSSNLKFLNIVGNEVRVTEHIFQGLDQLLILLTDTPFMCCVKPESVDDDHCVKDLSEIEKCRYKDDLCYSDAISSCYDLIASNAQKMCLWIIGVFALIGNVFVIIYSLYIAKHATTITTFSIFVLFLSISDCLMGIYLLIIGAADVRYRGVYSWNSQAWRESQICTLAGIIFNISSEMSTFLILSITIDRAFRTVFPMSLYSRKKISRKFAFAASGVLWLMSVVIAVIPAFPSKLYFKGEFYSQSGVCFTLPLTGDKQSGSEYSFAVFVCLNSFIFIVVALGEFCMFKSVKTSAGLMTQTRQLDIYVARVLFLVVATDFCCWLPIGIMGILAKGGYTIPDDAYGWVILFVLTINSAVNPLLNTSAIVWRQLVRASSWERQRLGRTSTGHQIRTDIEMNTLRLDVKNVNCL